MAQTPSTVKTINRKQIRRALKTWPDPAALGESPLAQLETVYSRRQAAGHADSPAGRGIALRHLMQEAVELLKPAATTDPPPFDQPRWRFYHILQQQFIHNRRAQDIREEMGISESGYFNDQRKALDALVNIFKEWELEEQATDPPLSSPTTTPTAGNLPHPPTPFIGRETERERIATLLEQEGCRLISIIGPGGMGKTRLAIQGAADQQAADGGRIAYFIQLDTIDTAELIVPTIAQTLHFTIQSKGDAQQQLIDFLRPKRWLLVLDNFEHLTRQGTETISAILHHAPQLKLIITSRERLNLRGEWVIDLHGLDVPDDAHPTAAPEKYSAVQLFMEALERVRAGQKATAAELPAIVHICQLVHGMPLGLELAASWGGMLSCADIAAEIQHSLDFLEAPLRDLPTRHQSLRAVFQHSWLLLTDAEQAAFRRLAVFRGSFDRPAAQEVAGAQLPLLHTLTSKSLLRVTDSGRYSVHPLLRQFAREKLRLQTEEWTKTKERHTQFYTSFMRDHLEALKQGGQQQAALERAKQELENIRLAWRWALSQQQYDQLLSTAEGVYYFFAMTNRVREGSHTMAQLVAQLQEQSSTAQSVLHQRLLGLAQGLQARFLYIMGRNQAAREQFEQALLRLQEQGTPAEQALISLLAIPSQIERDGFRPQQLYQHCLAYYEETGDRWAIATAHVRYVDYLRSTHTSDDQGIQRELMEQSLAIRQTIGDQRGVANCLNYLCDLAYARGDYEDAQKRAAQSLAIHQTLDNQLGRAHSLNHLGQVAGSLGNYDEARHAYQESLALLRTFGNPREVATALDCVGYVSYLLGEYDAAEPYYQESLEISQEIGDVHGKAWSLHNLGDIARAREAYQQAQTLYQESCRLHQENDPLSWGGAVALDKLGRVTLLMGEESQAETHFRAALRIATATGRAREALDALLNLSHLFTHRDQLQQAADALHLITHHPATAKETLDAAERLWATLPATPTPTPATLQELSERLLTEQAEEAESS